MQLLIFFLLLKSTNKILESELNSLKRDYISILQSFLSLSLDQIDNQTTMSVASSTTNLNRSMSNLNRSFVSTSSLNLSSYKNEGLSNVINRLFGGEKVN